MTGNSLHFEFLLEEPSAEAVMLELLPRLLMPLGHTFKLHAHQGKDDLRKKLPNKLKGYKAWIESHYRIVVLMDRDDDDGPQLKQLLEEMALNAGFTTKSSCRGGSDFVVLNRLAIEELESWFLGDELAIRTAYPRFHGISGKKKNYSNPDAIKGGTWEALERQLQASGYYKSRMPKVETARNIARHMSLNPADNRSRSFGHFITGIQAFWQ